MASRSTAFLNGIRNELPILVGVFPFGMIYGVLALEAGIPVLEAQAISAIVFAGSSQMVLTQLVRSATPALVMVLTIFVVNLRHALYSASLAPYVQHLSLRWKILLGYLLTDEAYAVAVVHYQDLLAKGISHRVPQQASVDTPGRVGDGPAGIPGMAGFLPHAHWFYLGAGLSLWLTWQTSTALGILLGAVIPAAWGLDFTLALTFIALVSTNVKDKPSIATVLAAGVTSLLGYSLPYKLGLILAAFVGVAVGLWIEGRKR